MLKTSEMNVIFSLHNSATEDEVYGERLYSYLLELQEQGLIDEDWVNQAFLMSIDWPLAIKI